MQFLAKLKKWLSTEKRFLQAFEKIEDNGFFLLLDVAAADVVSEDLKIRIHNYLKNLEKLDSLYEQYKDSFHNKLLGKI